VPFQLSEDCDLLGQHIEMVFCHVSVPFQLSEDCDLGGVDGLLYITDVSVPFQLSEDCDFLVVSERTRNNSQRAIPIK